MSNLIKSPYVNIKDNEVFIVDAEAKADKFAPLKNREMRREEHQTHTAVFGELGSESQEHPVEMDSFTAGMNLINADQILADEIKKSKLRAEQILEEARKSADELLMDAQNNVKQIHEDAYQAGKIEGYSAGEIEAKENMRLLEEEMRQKMDEQDAEYAALLEEIEPKYVDVLISLIQKLTGVILKEQRETLLFLIKQCLANLDKSNKYVIRVSKQDAHFIEAHKEEIKEIIGDEVAVEYWEEKSLKENECIIETDLQMVDCGFQAQLTNLTETLKFLVS